MPFDLEYSKINRTFALDILVLSYIFCISKQRVFVKIVSCFL